MDPFPAQLRARDPLCRRDARSLFREELQGPAAGGDRAHGVAAALAEAGGGGRLVVDVHGGVGPLGRRGAGGGAEEAAEAARGTEVRGRPAGRAPPPPPPAGAPDSQLPDGGLLLLLDRRVLTGGSTGAQGRSPTRPPATPTRPRPHPAQSDPAPPLSLPGALPSAPLGAERLPWPGWGCPGEALLSQPL